jgi:short-subunit dehydrogenase
MNRHSTRTAVIIGASSGIGEALAHELNAAGWRLGLLARRLERLEALRETLAPETVVRGFDVGQPDAAAILEGVLEELGGVDLAIISAGTGHNGALQWELDIETVTVNVLGFMAVAQVTMRHFLGRGRGHWSGFHRLQRHVAIVRPPTRLRKPSSRCISMAFGKWRGTPDNQSS